ncbi:class II histocompatibility antigen, M alpha chain-like, partial [Anomalospiza imberbis]|uniref:class II histocompatibility antigen, M alpha chain-like n=1 Tax=Anomalospiza imberbis TaxID=187417 RepID=UPI00358F7141
GGAGGCPQPHVTPGDPHPLPVSPRADFGGRAVTGAAPRLGLLCLATGDVTAAQRCHWLAPGWAHGWAPRWATGATGATEGPWVSSGRCSRGFWWPWPSLRPESRWSRCSRRNPPSPGEATTLVCLVENIFPPALDIGWTVAGAAVTRGVTLGPFIPSGDLTFVRFSRISVRPAAGDVHACVVTARRDNATAVAYWVAPDTALDEQLATALAGAVLALGLVLALLGAILALLARRDCNG